MTPTPIEVCTQLLNQFSHGAQEHLVIALSAIGNIIMLVRLFLQSRNTQQQVGAVAKKINGS